MEPTGNEQPSPRAGAASPQIGNRSTWIVHFAIAKSFALRSYLKSKDRYERLAVGLPNAEARSELIQEVHELQSKLGQPTEAQRLAGEAALDHISAYCGPPVSTVKPTTEMLVSEGSQSARQSTIHSSRAATSLIETTCSTETAPTSLGSAALSMISPDVLRSDLAYSLKANMPKPSRRWPCDAGCYAVFETQEDMINHKQKMHSARIWICSLCGSQFTELLPFRGHLEICDHRQDKPPLVQDSTDHKPNPCGCCERDAAQCHAQWGLDGHSTEHMPAGAWDLSVFDRELAVLAMSEAPSISTQLFVCADRSATGPPIPKLLNRGTEVVRIEAWISPLELSALWPGDGSKAYRDFDLDRDVFLDAWEYGIIIMLLNHTYVWLTAQGYKIGWACAGEEKQSGGNGSTSLQPTHPNPSHPSSRKRAYREGHTVPPSESSTSSDEHRERKTQKSGEDSSNLKKKKPRFACPYWKASAEWRSKEPCTNGNEGWQKLSKVREHLCKVHKEKMSLICEKALQKSEGREDMNAEETWHALFRTVMPSHQTVGGSLPSPYYTPLEVVPGQNSIQKALRHLRPDDQRSVISQVFMPIALPVIESHLNGEPEEIRPQLKSTLDKFVLNFFFYMGENVSMESWLAISKFKLQRDTMSQLSTMSKARAIRDAPQSLEYDQAFYTGGADQVSASLVGSDCCWANPEGFPKGSHFVDSAYESMPYLSGDLDPHLHGGTFGTEQLWAGNSSVPVSYHPQPNQGMFGQTFAPSNSALRYGPILNEVASPFDTKAGAQSVRTYAELASPWTYPRQLIVESERDDSIHASQPHSSVAYSQPPPLDCPHGTENCGLCTILKDKYRERDSFCFQ